MRVSTRGCLTVVEGFPGHLRGLTCRHVGPHACAHRWQGISDTCAQTRAHAHARGVLHGSRRHGTGRHFRHAVRASTHHDPQKLRYSMQPACSGAQRLCLPTWRGALGGGSPCPPAPPAIGMTNLRLRVCLTLFCTSSMPGMRCMSLTGAVGSAKRAAQRLQRKRKTWGGQLLG